MYNDYSIVKAAVRLLGGQEPPKVTPTPQQAIDSLLEHAALYNGPNVPGACYKSLSPEVKEVLEKCDSKDFNRRI